MSIQQLMETDARTAMMLAQGIRGLTLGSPAHIDAVDLFNDLKKLFVMLEKNAIPKNEELRGYDLGDAAKHARHLISFPSKEVVARTEKIFKILNKILGELKIENPKLYKFVLEGLKAGSANT